MAEFVERYVDLEVCPEGEEAEVTLTLIDSIPSGGDYEHYTGEYDVTPLITAQTLATNNRIMDDDVRIEMIPTREVENPAGGVTFIIG